MIKVKIGELRNHLSKYLKKVRQGGEITVTDRDTPIARIMPPRRHIGKHMEEAFEPQPPARPFSEFLEFQGMTSECPVDPVEVLLEDRRKR